MAVKLAEFGADLAGVGVTGPRAKDKDVAEVVEDVQGVLPGGASGGRVADGVVRVTEVAKNAGFVVAVAELVVQGEGPLVTGGGSPVVAEVVVGVAEAVKRISLAAAVTEFLE